MGVQEQAKHKRTSGGDLGPADLVKCAEAFGVFACMINFPDEIAPVLRKAFEAPGPVRIGIPMVYRDNHMLFENVRVHLLN